MKRIFTLFFIGISSTVIAQTTLNNPGFEDWTMTKTVDSLEQWFTSSNDNVSQGHGVLNATSTTDAQDGNLALHLETEIFYDIWTGQTDTSFGYALLGNPPGSGPGIPPYIYTDTADNFTGYYKCDIQTGDTALILIEMYKAGVTYGTGFTTITGTQNSWTQFNVPIIGGGTDAPDSIFVGFTSSDPFNPANVQEGSWIEIDNISLEYSAGSTVPAALVNNSFENFYTEFVETPDMWWGMDPMIHPFTGSAYAVKSTNAHSGSSSIEITTTAYNLFAGIPSLVSTGWYDYSNFSFHGGDPFIAQPDSLVGWYQYSTLTTDTAYVWIEVWNQGTGTLADSALALFPANTWTYFSIPLDLTEAPDSMRLTLYSGDELGSELLIDDLDIVGGDLNVQEVKSEFSMLYYPNPANQQLFIEFNEADQLEIVDVSGKVILNESITGKTNMTIPTANWNNGLYFIRIKHDDSYTTKKLIVRH